MIPIYDVLPVFEEVRNPGVLLGDRRIPNDCHNRVDDVLFDPVHRAVLRTCCDADLETLP